MPSQVIHAIVGTAGHIDHGKTALNLYAVRPYAFGPEDELTGMAFASDADADPDLTRDLYAALSPQWVAQGIFAHYALVPIHDRAALAALFETRAVLSAGDRPQVAQGRLQIA